MKRWLTAMALSLCVCTPAAAEYWPHDSSHAVACKDGRPGCQILQMVMMGCFDYAEAPDSLDERVLSAVLPKLRAVEEAEFAHFCGEFAVEEGVIRRYYYTALKNCLLADIHLNPDPGGDETLVRRVLGLFLDPDSEENGQQQIEVIRSEMTEALAARMAEELSVPVGFVADLMDIGAAAP